MILFQAKLRSGNILDLTIDKVDKSHDFKVKFTLGNAHGFITYLYIFIDEIQVKAVKIMKNVKGTLEVYVNVFDQVEVICSE